MLKEYLTACTARRLNKSDCKKNNYLTRYFVMTLDSLSCEADRHVNNVVTTYGRSATEFQFISTVQRSKLI
jgi:hypothetical protein